MTSRALLGVSRNAGMVHASSASAQPHLKQASLERFRYLTASFSGVPEVVEDVLHAPGEPLDQVTQKWVGSRFPYDFSSLATSFAARSAREKKVSRRDDPSEAAAETIVQRVFSAETAPDPKRRADLSRVRVHADAHAAEAARALNARAFAVGPDVVFGAGEYRPQSSAGRRLLTHELAHMTPQGGALAEPGNLIRRMPAATADITPPPATPIPPPPEREPAGTPGQKTDAGVGSQAGSAPAAPGAAPSLAVAGKAAPEQPAVKDKAGLKPPAPGVEPAKEKDKEAEAEQPKSLADVPTGDLDLIDQELAEHERWGEAAARLGAAGSKQRAEFAAKAAEEGATTGFTEGLKQGVKSGAALKVAEKLGEKALVMGVKLLGKKSGNLIPVPGLGAAIGGAIAAYDLASRDWSATGESLGKFGKGADVYDKLANSLEATSTALEVATQVLNVIAGVLGAITVIMWIATVLSAGVLSPVAGTLTAIAAGIQIGTMVLDAINALVLKRLIVLFRALHAFTSDADPRDVVTQGKAIEEAAGATTGFLGGVAGGAALEGGLKLGKKGMKGIKKLSTPVPEHPMPAPLRGEGTTVKAQPQDPAAARQGAVPEAAEPAKPAQTAAPDKAVVVEQKPPTAEVATKPQTPATEAGASTSQPKTPATGPPEQQGAADASSGTQANATLQSTEPAAKPAKKAGKQAKPRLTADERRAAAKERARAADIASTYAEEIGEKRAMAPKGGRVDPELHNIPGAKPKEVGTALKKGEKTPGRWQHGDPEPEIRAREEKRVFGSVRERSKKAFEKATYKGLTDFNETTELTAATRERLEAEGVDLLVETEENKGKLPHGFEESHLATVKGDPLAAETGKASVGATKREHLGEHHAGDPTAPLETMSPRTEIPPEQEGFQLKPEKGKGYSDPGVMAESRKQMEYHEREAKRAADSALAAEKRGRSKQAQKAQSEAANHEILARKYREALPKMRELVTGASKEAKRDLGRVGKIGLEPKTSAPVPPEAAISPFAAQADKASAAIASKATTTTTTPPKPQAQETKAPVPPEAATAPSEALADKTTAVVPSEETTSPSGAQTDTSESQQPKFRVEDGNLKELSSSAGEVLAKQRGEEPTKVRISRADLVAETEPATEQEALAQAELAAEGEQERPKKKLSLNLGGDLSTPGREGMLKGESKSEGFDKARQEPIVEHVNPNYAPPPCSPQDIVNAQNEILRTLDARAEAQGIQSDMAGQEAHHKENEKPLQKMDKRTRDAIEATRAHQAALQRRTEGNKEKQKNEKESEGILSDYGNRAARLAMLTGPLRAFSQFTSLAYGLPDSPDELLKVKHGIIKMNSDSSRFLHQLESVDKTVNEQKASQPERSQQTAADNNTLQKTDQQSKEAAETFDKSKQKTEDLTKENEAKRDEAKEYKQEANQSAANLQGHAEKKKTQAENLAVSLQFWARTHERARVDALNQTKKRLQAQGYKILEVKPL
jgi:hypothetical protein